MSRYKTKAEERADYLGYQRGYHAGVKKSVKHGRWKPFDLTYGRSIYFCTACNEAAEVPTFNGKPMYKWCPNCGALMVNEDEEMSKVSEMEVAYAEYLND